MPPLNLMLATIFLHSMAHIYGDFGGEQFVGGCPSTLAKTNRPLLVCL
jgi:hypothetical protein